MEKRVKNLLIGSGMMAAGMSAMGAISYAATKHLVDVAMDRQPVLRNPDKMKVQIQGYEEDGPFMRQLGSAAEQLRNTPHETVHITGFDGEQLVGHWFACKNAKRIVVAMHGWRSSWDHDFGTIYPFLKKNGCSVLCAEQRGQGSSGGAYIGFGMLERFDCREWIKWVNSRCDGKLPLYLAGVSMGAATVLMTAGLELPENVRGIVADCGFTSPNAIWRHVAKNNLHMNYGIRAGVLDTFCHKKIQLKTGDYSTLQAMQHCKIPVMFVHGTKDHFVPVEMTYENYEACAAPKRLLIVPGADHGMCYFMEKERYEKMLTEFWEVYDK